MNEGVPKSTIPGILQLLAIATAIAIASIIAILLMPVPFKSYFSDTLQFLWPLLGIILLTWISYASDEANVKYLTRLFSVALIPWTITILLWEVVLPLTFNDALAYYVSGFGFLLCYVIIIYGLMKLIRSRQWYITPSTNAYVNLVGFLVAIALLGFVALNIKWDSPHLPDVLILLLYLAADIVILVQCSRLINMHLKPGLKYLVFVISEFVLINSIGDILFMARWLIPLRQVWSYKITDVIDPIYNISLIFMVTSLFLFLSPLKNWVLVRLERGFGGQLPFVEDIMANSPDAMFVCDEDGFLIIANEPLFRLFGGRRADLLGRFNLFDHMGALDEEVGALRSRIMAGEVVSKQEVVVHLKGETSSRSMSFKIFSLRGPSGKIANYVGIMEDTTEKLRMEAELLESKRQIELYMDLMGHDINNMNQIGAGFLEMALEKLAKEGGIGTDSAIFLEKPLESFMNSSRLISNIRKIQKIRKKELIVEPVEVGKAIGDAVAEYRDLKGRAIDIQYTLAAGLSVMANSLLKDVFVNVIGNAIKHSPADRPLRIAIRADRVSDAGKDYVRIAIEDDGPGIEDARKALIFERFTAGASRAKGPGLGLYLVRTLVDSYGGKVWVEDRVPGDHRHGSRFVILLLAGS